MNDETRTKYLNDRSAGHDMLCHFTTLRSVANLLPQLLLAACTALANLLIGAHDSH